MVFRFDFVSPSRRFRELRILGEVARNECVSLRSLAAAAFLGRTTAHQYVCEMQEKGWLRIEREGKRAYRYRITACGRARLDELALHASQEVVRLYGLVKAEFQRRLQEHARAGARQVVLFGAAETAEIVDAAAEGSGLEIVAVVDNDPHKHGRRIGSHRVEPPTRLTKQALDTVLITSTGHSSEIYEQIRHVERAGVRVLCV